MLTQLSADIFDIEMFPVTSSTNHLLGASLEPCCVSQLGITPCSGMRWSPRTLEPLGISPEPQVIADLFAPELVMLSAVLCGPQMF